MVGADSLIDLHVHTVPRSRDSGLSPQALVARAREVGLTAICTTEHNAIWSSEEAARLAREAGLPVLRGIEVGTDVGHVLAFGLDVFRREWWEVEELRRAADEEGAVLILAHPLRSPGFARPWEQLPDLFDGIEVVNADESELAAKQVGELAERYGLAATGGSDAHAARAVGRAATRFEGRIATEAELVAAIRARNCRPCLASPAR